MKYLPKQRTIFKPLCFCCELFWSFSSGPRLALCHHLTSKVVLSFSILCWNVRGQTSAGISCGLSSPQTAADIILCSACCSGVAYRMASLLGYNTGQQVWDRPQICIIRGLRPQIPRLHRNLKYPLPVLQGPTISWQRLQLNRLCCSYLSPFQWAVVVDRGPVSYLPSAEVSVKAGHVKKKRHPQGINQE